MMFEHAKTDCTVGFTNTCYKPLSRPLLPRLRVNYKKSWPFSDLELYEFHLLVKHYRRFGLSSGEKKNKFLKLSHRQMHSAYMYLFLDRIATVTTTCLKIYNIYGSHQISLKKMRLTGTITTLHLKRQNKQIFLCLASNWQDALQQDVNEKNWGPSVKCKERKTCSTNCKYAHIYALCSNPHIKAQCRRGKDGNSTFINKPLHPKQIDHKLIESEPFHALTPPINPNRVQYLLYGFRSGIKKKESLFNTADKWFLLTNLVEHM